MTTIMIIDDEPLIRRGLESMIPWNQLECRLIDQAQNGEEGLLKIIQQKPDIVFTDIKMPKMDGLTMIQKVLEEPDPPLFIILSGYNDFDLVRSAMRLGAIDYLMKLNLEESELKRVITEARDQAAKKHKNIQNAYPISDKFKEDFINDLLHVKADRELYTKMMPDSFAIKEGFFYRLLCLKLQETSEVPREYNNWAQNFLITICKEQFPQDTELHEYQLDDLTYVLYMESQDGIPDSILTEKSKSMIAEIKKYLNQEIMIGISANHRNILHLPKAYEESLQSMAFFIGGMDNHIHFYTDLLHIDRLKDQLAQWNGDMDFFEPLENLLLQIQTFMTQQGSIEEDRTICFLLITKLYGIDSKSHEFFTHWFGIEYHTIRDFYDMNDSSMFITWLLRLSQGVTQYSQQYMNEIYRNKVKKATQYIYENRFKKIALNDVAAQLEITPSYLSKIFKKVTQQSFSDYIAEIKIEEAKKLLLLNNNRIYEVSAMIGYEDPYYFSKVFKRVTQMTPSEYIARN
ncbi:MAG: response regulator [Hungatella sp.]